MFKGERGRWPQARDSGACPNPSPARVATVHQRAYQEGEGRKKMRLTGSCEKRSRRVSGRGQRTEESRERRLLTQPGTASKPVVLQPGLWPTVMSLKADGLAYRT